MYDAFICGRRRKNKLLLLEGWDQAKFFKLFPTVLVSTAQFMVHIVVQDAKSIII